MKEDFSAALTIQELRLDRITKDQVKKEGLEFLARLSQSLHQDSSSSTIIKPPEEFHLHDMKFCDYELGSPNDRRRIVVFGARGKFYECETVALKKPSSADGFIRLFTIQQSFLASLTVYGSSS